MYWVVKVRKFLMYESLISYYMDNISIYAKLYFESCYDNNNYDNYYINNGLSDSLMGCGVYGIIYYITIHNIISVLHELKGLDVGCIMLFVPIILINLFIV